MKKTVVMYVMIALIAIFSAVVQPASVVNAEVAATQVVNINHADLVQLQTLPGVGPALAERIVTHREANGPYASIEQLLDVKGIGDKKLEKIKAHLVFE